MDKNTLKEKFNENDTTVNSSSLFEAIGNLIMSRRNTESDRIDLAQYAINEHRDILITDASIKVRSAVAKYGTDAHRDILITDTSIKVRSAVAEYGTDTHRDILVKDRCADVLIAVGMLSTSIMIQA